MSFQNIKKKWESILYQKKFFRGRVKELTARRFQIESSIDLHNKAIQLMEEIGQELQQRLSDKLAAVATASIQIYPEPYDAVKIIVSEKARTKGMQAEIFFERNGLEVKPILPNGQFMAGGAVIEMAAFGKRVAVWHNTFPRPRGIFLLDEPFRFQNPELREQAMNILLDIAGKFGLQIIMITQHSDMARMADNQIEIRKS